MTTSNGLVLFAFLAFWITLIHQCHSNDLGPTVSLTINYRDDGKEAGPIDKFFLPRGIVYLFLDPFVKSYFEKYQGMIVLHHLGINTTVVPPVLVKNYAEFQKMNQTMVDAMNASFGGKPLIKVPKLFNLTAKDVQKWAKDVMNPTDRAPVMYVLVDYRVWNSEWDQIHKAARQFNVQGFEAVVTFNNYEEDATRAQICAEKYGVFEDLGDRRTEEAHEYLSVAVANLTSTHRTNTVSADQCHYVSQGKCGITDKIREPADYRFYPECPQEKCNTVCQKAKQIESKCSAQCKKTKGAEKGSDPKLQHCPVEEIGCTEEPCKKPPTTAPKPSKVPLGPDISTEEQTTTSGVGAPQKVPIWQVLLLWFGVVQAGRMRQWMEE